MVKARFMSSMVRGVTAAMEVNTGSQLLSAPSRGEPSEPLCRAAAQAVHDWQSAGARMSWMLRTVGMHEAVHWRGSVVGAEGHGSRRPVRRAGFGKGGGHCG